MRWGYNTMCNIYGEVWKIRLILILGKLCEPASRLLGWKYNTELHNPKPMPLSGNLFLLYSIKQQLYWENQKRRFCCNFTGNISQIFSYLWQIWDFSDAQQEELIIFNRSSATYRKKRVTSIISLCFCTTCRFRNSHKPHFILEISSLLCTNHSHLFPFRWHLHLPIR